MENDEVFNSDSFNQLVTHYKSAKQELNQVKQNLYETSRQLKLNEALITEYQSDIDLLQNKEQIENEKFVAKVASLEETITNLRSSNLQNISYLESELEKKEKENEDLKNQIEIFKNTNSLEATLDVSTNLHEIINLTNQNELLQGKVGEMQETLENLQCQRNKLEEILEEFKDELSEIKENLKLKNEELLEKRSLIDKLNDELICANRELENYKQKPLEADSRGNSLFAEVDDRRVHLQETINQMKSSYMRLRQEHGQHVKLISRLRKENADIRESWKNDLEGIQEDKYWVNDTLKRHVKVLEELLEDQKKQLKEQSMMVANGLLESCDFYHQIVDEKSKETEQWKKKYSDKSVNEYLLSVNLAQANKQIRLLKLELQQQTEEIEEAKAKKEAEEDQIVCHKCLTSLEDQEKDKELETEENREEFATQFRLPIKSCLKQKEVPADETLIFSNTNDLKKKDGYNIFSNDLPRYTVTQRKKTQQFDDINTDEDTKENITINISAGITEDLISFQDNKENVDLSYEESDKEKKGVTFSEDTVEPVGNPVRRRGTRIFMAKKTEENSTSF